MLERLTLRTGAHPRAGRRAIWGSGAPADVCVFDPEAAWRVAADALRSRGQNSPFLGWELLGQVTHTLLEGRIVYEREDIEPS